MNELILSRRKFFVGASAALIAAPALVRFSSLMPLKVIKPPKLVYYTGSDYLNLVDLVNIRTVLLDEMYQITVIHPMLIGQNPS